MQKAYFFPSEGRIPFENPYPKNFKRALEAAHFDVLYSRRRPTVLGTLSLLWYAFRADVFFLNWLENVGVMHLPLVQFLLARVALAVIRLRRKRIVWIQHNLTPHEGTNWMTRSMRRTLCRVADVVVSHSREAADAIRAEVGGRSVYLCHPVAPVPLAATELSDTNETDTDVFIWGKVLPYKGVAEFLANDFVQRGSLSVNVVGRCDDPALTRRIESLCNERIKFKNRVATFDEIAARCRSSRWVVFPYIGECVSSSGALIDTVVMGGNPVGPDRGAFRDLAELGVCRTYRNDEELAAILQSDWRIDDDARRKFIEENSWPMFIERITELTPSRPPRGEEADTLAKKI
ncbi:MAG: glycosyltransferase [Bacteroidales bacterium]|nr:glycosyltransferase [Bacteroidales bacterium]